MSLLIVLTRLHDSTEIYMLVNSGSNHYSLNEHLTVRYYNCGTATILNMLNRICYTYCGYNSICSKYFIFMPGIISTLTFKNTSGGTNTTTALLRKLNIHSSTAYLLSILISCYAGVEIHSAQLHH